MEENKPKRPHLPDHILEHTKTDAEDFQNRVLRPLIKMQSGLLMAHLTKKLETLKIVLEDLSHIQQTHTLTTLFSNDNFFKREIIGIVIGHFTVEEYQTYAVQNKEFNRRIVQIVLHRSIDLLIAEE